MWEMVQFQKLDQVLAGVALAPPRPLVDAAELALPEIGIIPLSFCLATRAASETTPSGWIAKGAR